MAAYRRRTTEILIKKTEIVESITDSDAPTGAPTEQRPVEINQTINVVVPNIKQMKKLGDDVNKNKPWRSSFLGKFIEFTIMAILYGILLWITRNPLLKFIYNTVGNFLYPS